MKRSIISLFCALFVLSSCLLPKVYATQADGEPTEATEQAEETQPESNPQYTDVKTGSSIGLDATGALCGPYDTDFNAAAILLYEMNSGTMVYAKNIDGLRYPASLTKVMTCLLALELGNLEDSVTVSEGALKGLHPNGSSAKLIAGEIFTLDQLLYCLMIQSANDSAPVIAEHLAGSEEAFVELMNERAKELGCTGTHFENTHGLHNDNHFTTARDMAKIFTAALGHEKFREIYATTRYEIPPTNMNEDTRILSTTNYLISTNVTASYYDSRVIGGKTGFTTPAGRCVMVTAEKNDLRYLCVVMGAENIMTQEMTVYGSFIVASDVLDLGFKDYTLAEVISPLSPVAQVPVSGASESVVLAPSASITTLLPKNYDPTLLSTTFVLSDPNGLSAPLAAGQKVGTAQRYYGSVCIGEVPLVTVTDVDKQVLTTHEPTPEMPTQEVQESPWKTVVMILMVLFVFLILLSFYTAWARYQRKKRRQRRRKQV